MDETVEERLAALEARNRQLEDQVAALRREALPPAPRPPRQPLGQGPRPFGDATGAHFTGTPDASMTSTGGGTHSFHPWRTGPDGERQWRPDGGSFARDPQSGEIVHGQPSAAPASPAGPVRTPAHERAVELIDAMLPIEPMRLDPEG